MKIAVLDGYQLNPGDLSWSELKALGKVEIYDTTSDEEIVERAQGAEVVISNKVPFTRETLDKLPDLKCIIVSATGYNIIDTEAARDKGVVVCNSPDYSTESVTQHVFALLLAIYNQVRIYSDEVKENKWAKAGDWSYTNEPIANLNGKTLGIVGFGQIGHSVSEVALAFGMKVIAHHKHPKRDARANVGFVDLETLWATADVITLHVPLTETTQHMINENALRQMKSSAVLINTGRGPLIDEEALYNALNNNEIRAAGLDVLVDEPPRENHPLNDLKNCLITPHIAWAGVYAREKLMSILIDNVKAFKEGSPVNQVN